MRHRQYRIATLSSAAGEPPNGVRTAVSLIGTPSSHQRRRAAAEAADHRRIKVEVCALASASRKVPPGETGASKNGGLQAIGRSRGGLATRIHLVAANARMAFCFACSPGQAADGSEGRRLIRRFKALWRIFSRLEMADQMFTGFTHFAHVADGLLCINMPRPIDRPIRASNQPAPASTLAPARLARERMAAGEGKRPGVQLVEQPRDLVLARAAGGIGAERQFDLEDRLGDIAETQ